MELEYLDNLIVSLIDVEANKGLFKRELARKLDVPVELIQDPFIESEQINGVVKQYLYVGLAHKVPISNLLKLDIDYFDNGFLVFDIGDVVL
jgi:hypothetical protein